MNDKIFNKMSENHLKISKKEDEMANDYQDQ